MLLEELEKGEKGMGAGTQSTSSAKLGVLGFGVAS